MTEDAHKALRALIWEIAFLGGVDPAEVLQLWSAAHLVVDAVDGMIPRTAEPTPPRPAALEHLVAETVAFGRKGSLARHKLQRRWPASPRRGPSPWP